MRVISVFRSSVHSHAAHAIGELKKASLGVRSPCVRLNKHKITLKRKRTSFCFVLAVLGLQNELMFPCFFDIFKYRPGLPISLVAWLTVKKI